MALPPPYLQEAVNVRIRRFFEDFSCNLAEGLNCVLFHEIKRRELFLLLRAYCAREDLFRLFFPLLGCRSGFYDFVFRHYKEVSNVSEFAELANMSLRNFQRRFKAEFSCSAREWLMTRKAEAILYELRFTRKDLMAIATDYGFSAMSYFATFCKHHLGMSPSGLRGQRLGGA